MWGRTWTCARRQCAAVAHVGALEMKVAWLPLDLPQGCTLEVMRDGELAAPRHLMDADVDKCAARRAAVARVSALEADVAGACGLAMVYCAPGLRTTPEYAAFLTRLAAGSHRRVHYMHAAVGPLVAQCRQKWRAGCSRGLPQVFHAHHSYVANIHVQGCC